MDRQRICFCCLGCGYTTLKFQFSVCMCVSVSVPACVCVFRICFHLNADLGCSAPTGLQQQGIFRIPGSQVEVNDIKNSFERGRSERGPISCLIVFLIAFSLPQNATALPSRTVKCRWIHRQHICHV